MSLHPLEERFLASFPIEKRGSWPIVMAVSGGPDSVALFHLVRRTHPPHGGRLIVAHVNHQLRGAESEEDARFCAELAESLGIEFRLCLQPVKEIHRGGVGLEAAARQLRYHALREVAEQTGARYVLTGHTANDQAETILFRVFRGAGLRGLCGIPRARPFGPAALLRPLLDFRREELLAYLRHFKWPYRVDRTNQSLDFARNCIRHTILPEAVRGVHPAVLEGILRVGCNAQEAWDFIENAVAEGLEKCVITQSPNEVVLNRGLLAQKHPFLVQQMVLELWLRQRWPLRKMSRRHVVYLAHLLRFHEGSFCQDFPGNVRVQLVPGQAILSRRKSRRGPAESEQRLPET